MRKETNMSEKEQHTAAKMREQMMSRYGDDLRHKHNKLHCSYRKHYKTHPSQINHKYDQEPSTNCGTGLIHQLNLQKVRKRLDKGRIH